MEHFGRIAGILTLLCCMSLAGCKARPASQVHEQETQAEDGAIGVDDIEALLAIVEVFEDQLEQVGILPEESAGLALADPTQDRSYTDEEVKLLRLKIVDLLRKVEEKKDAKPDDLKALKDSIALMDGRLAAIEKKVGATAQGASASDLNKVLDRLDAVVTRVESRTVAMPKAKTRAPDAAITNACYASFGSGPNGVKCAQSAASVEVAKDCGYLFGRGDRGAQCTQGAASGDVVKNCAHFFGSGDRGLQCAQGAASDDVVKNCGHLFGSGDRGILCAQGAPSGDVVKNCAHFFGSGDRGVQCVQSAPNAALVKSCVQRSGATDKALECVSGK